MELFAIKVTQPLGDFFVGKIKAKDLQKISYTEEFKYDASGRQVGTQRPRDEKRLKEISQFIKSEEMCFPTSILLAISSNAHDTSYNGEDLTCSNIRVQKIDGDVYKLFIPDNEHTAVIIDGQHRLNAFKYAEECGDIELVCSIFFDLPNPYQAYLFASINGNQKKVDKSLALEFFGYNVEEEPKNQWTPEKLAVFLTRKLNFKLGSPLYHQLKLAASYDDEENDKKLASTAAMAEGILSLISSNPKRDRDMISATKNTLFSKRNRAVVANQKDSTPLRNLYLECLDQELYDILVNYFSVINEGIWSQAGKKSVIKKTIGVLALFDLLKNIVKINSVTQLSKGLFESYVKKFDFIDFSDNYFSTSGLGQGRIKRIIKYLAGITAIDTLKSEDINFLQNSCNGHFIFLAFVHSVAYNYAKRIYTQSSFVEAERLPQINIEQSTADIIECLYTSSGNNHIIRDIFSERNSEEKDFYDMLYEYVNYSDLESECVSGINDAGKDLFGDRFTSLVPSI